MHARVVLMFSFVAVGARAQRPRPGAPQLAPLLPPSRGSGEEVDRCHLWLKRCLAGLPGASPPVACGRGAGGGAAASGRRRARAQQASPRKRRSGAAQRPAPHTAQPLAGERLPRAARRAELCMAGGAPKPPKKAQAAIQACARHTRSLSSPQRRTHTQTRLSFVRTHTPATHTPRQLRAAREHGAGTPACRRACAARARQLPPNTHAPARAPAVRPARYTPPSPPIRHTPGAAARCGHSAARCGGRRARRTRHPSALPRRRRRGAPR
jgi:hypothetical protein